MLLLLLAACASDPAPPPAPPLQGIDVLLTQRPGSESPNGHPAAEFIVTVTNRTSEPVTVSKLTIGTELEFRNVREWTEEFKSSGYRLPLAPRFFNRTVAPGMTADFRIISEAFPPGLVTPREIPV